MKKKGSKHPGFKVIAQRISAKMGIPFAQANAILASRTRHASRAAVRKNPRLKRVKQ